MEDIEDHEGLENINLDNITVVRPNENEDEVYYKDGNLIAIWASSRGLETVQPLSQQDIKEITEYRFSDQ